MSRLIYKIATRDVVEKARAAGAMAGMPVDLADGYVHFSTAEQLRETLARHFRGQDGLVLLGVDSDALGDRLVWEPSRGGALFPHLYAQMPMAAVVFEAEIAVDADGYCPLPETVK